MLLLGLIVTPLIHGANRPLVHKNGHITFYSFSPSGIMADHADQRIWYITPFVPTHLMSWSHLTSTWPLPITGAILEIGVRVGVFPTTNKFVTLVWPCISVKVSNIPAASSRTLFDAYHVGRVWRPKIIIFCQKIIAFNAKSGLTTTVTTP